MYVFDNSPLSTLLNNFYRSRFPTLWGNFELLIAVDEVTSTREVKNELERYGRANLEWMDNNSGMFTIPTNREIEFVKEIYKVRHFQQNIEHKKIQAGGFNADPFVVAKAAVNDGIVVTMERKPENGSRIPNICDYFEIEYCNLEDFMIEKGWQF